ncbi:MAG: CPBP family intramembrane metalloprotease [Acidobacteria bacterium]|nr:CPBP family intramembrane metalloprotease [Acidobacteriota bacterium]
MDAAIILGQTALLAVVPLMSPAGALPAGAGVIALTTLAWHRCAPAATSLGLLFATCLALSLVGLGPQQVVFTAAFAIYAFVVRRVPWLRGAAAWFRRGSVDRPTVALGAAVVTISAVALLSWYAVASPDLADLVRTFVPSWSVWLLVPGALLLSLVNAATEEAAYRGVVLEALDDALGPGPMTVVVQAVAFGTLHFQAGFPRGTAGVGLAFAYGLALGALRRKSDGLLAPWIVHVLTDLVIFAIVLTLAKA